MGLGLFTIWGSEECFRFRVGKDLGLFLSYGVATGLVAGTEFSLKLLTI